MTALAMISCALGAFIGGQTAPVPSHPQRIVATAEFKEAADLLSKTILDDPTGGEFSEVTISVGTAWSGAASPCKCTGWVFPAKDGRPASVVCWNGLAYTPVSVGSKLDLAAFVAAAVRDNKSGWPHAAEGAEAAFVQSLVDRPCS